MAVSSNLSRRRFPHGSFLWESCGVSVPELDFATVSFSGDRTYDARTFLGTQQLFFAS